MFENRKYAIYGTFILIGIIYALRLLFLQVFDSTYETASNAVKRIIDVPFRGQIYDRSGRLIVSNTPVYDLYVTPRKVKIADTTAFCDLLKITRPEFDSLMQVAKVYSKVKSSVFLRQLSKPEIARIQDAMVDYEGFETIKSSVRDYQTKSLANTLGYVSEVSEKQLEKQETAFYRQGDLMGQSGLEKYYENVLRGQRGVRLIMQDVKGVAKGSWKDGELDTIAVAGKDLYTSIDLDLQEFTDSLLQHKVGCAIAIEPATGEILAIASAPTYDPALLSTGRAFSKNYGRLVMDELRPLFNRPVQARYRPGSTFKLVQALVGMQSGAIGPGTVFNAQGTPFKPHVLYGMHNLFQAIRFSSNPYFYNVFKRIIYNNPERNVYKKSVIGYENWRPRVEKFGFGRKLGIDLPSEIGGLLPDVAYFDKMYGQGRWKFSNTYSLSIGEGDLIISPLKMANVVAIVANRGWYIPPHIVSGVGKPGDVAPEYQQKISVGVDKRYFEPVIDGMEAAVEHGTVDRSANIPGIVICGKTGTSQNRFRGRVMKDHSIFVCFAPKYQPKIAVAVFIEYAGYGGYAAAPIASLMIEKYLKKQIERKGYAAKWMDKNYMGNVPRVGID